MPRSLNFYRDILEFEVVAQAPDGASPDWVWLRRGTAELMLNTMYEASDRPAGIDPARASVHGDTTFYIGTPDVDGMYAYLRKHGVDVQPPATASYGMRQAYLRDPDGYAVCFQWQA